MKVAERHSVGQVTVIEGGEFVIRFMTPVTKARASSVQKFVWPPSPEVRPLDICQVVNMLGTPKKDKKKGTPHSFAYDFTPLCLV